MLPRTIARLSVLCSLTFTQACYTYASIDPSGVPPGVAVRARVNAAAAERLAALIPSSQRRLVAGTVVDNGPSGMIVEVPAMVPADVGTSLQTLHQRVAIAHADLIELEARQLDRVRTGAFVAGIALVAGSVAISAFKDNGSSERIPGGGTTDIRILLLRVFP